MSARTLRTVETPIFYRNGPRSCSGFVSSWKFNVVDVQNAILAGGVAVGAVADLMIQPYGALLAGAITGAISTAGYQVVQVSLSSY